MNIRWESYKKEYGLNDEDVKGSDYIVWIMNKVGDYRKTHKIKGCFTAKQNAEFEEWLRNEGEL